MSESPARVLVVEDEPAQSELLETLLRQEDYRVILARDGRSGLLRAKKDHPDLILLDVLLPEMSGFEVCQRLRQDPSTRLIPIIMLTALSQIKDKVTGLKLGADEYVAKPFDALELLARVERTLRRRRDDLSAHPLTNLPGGVALEEEIRRRLAVGDPFSVGCLDVKGLDVFNRAYGYDRGDHVIRLVGMSLKSAVLELADKNDLAGHFGGDDFGFVSTMPRAAVVAARVLENAEALFPMQLDPADRARGEIHRDGRPPLRGPLLRLTVGVADVEGPGPTHPAPILDLARAALREAEESAAGPLVRKSAPPK